MTKLPALRTKFAEMSPSLDNLSIDNTWNFNPIKYALDLFAAIVCSCAMVMVEPLGVSGDRETNGDVRDRA